MQSDKEFTNYIGLDDRYIKLVSITRKVLSRCIKISMSNLNADTTLSELKKHNPEYFDNLDFYDLLLNELLNEKIDFFTNKNNAENCVNNLLKTQLFDFKILGVTIYNGCPTIGKWVRDIILNCIPFKE
ncbi:MAG: hypothetical protein Q4G68_09900 [Planctomycetia bacterium]|nr:hypothetical protein [Planctomycetia bacterium]